MADYTEIEDEEMVPDAPITSLLGFRYRDNPLAMFEGAPDAPRIQPKALANGTLLFGLGTSTTPIGANDLGGIKRIQFIAYGKDVSAQVRFGLINNGASSGRAPSYTGAGRSLEISAMQWEAGATASPIQTVTSANDITEAGVSDIWHLWDDGNDSLNAAPLPAGTYGLAYVDVLGAVTVTTVTSNGTTPINTLRTERQADVILRQGAFSATEEAAIREYWS